MTTRCKNCREMIDFVRLRSGKMCPVESSEPAAYLLAIGAPGVPRRRIVTSDGLIIDGAEVIDPNTGTTVIGCEVHTCPTTAI